MASAALIVLFFLEILVVIGMLACLIWLVALLYSLYLSVPFVPTPYAAYATIFEALEIKDEDVVYELGSGDGRMLVAAATRYPNTSFIGVELNPLLCALARMRAKWTGVSRNVHFLQKDLFETDLSHATKLYMYLLDSRMQTLYPKLQHDLNSARVASLAFTFKDKEPLQVIELSKKPGSHRQNRLYIYDF